MEEIVDGVFHWSALHEGIQRRVHSAFVAATGPPVLIDPMPADVDMDWFEGREPAHVYLTNRHHYRASARFVQAFGCEVHCHVAGLHEFENGADVKGFRHGDELPGGILAVEVGSLCPEETALHIPVGDGVLAIGDAVVRFDTEMTFVPDELIGENPEAVKEGIRAALRRALELPFDTLVLAHGEPWVGGARQTLADWLDGDTGR